MDGEVITPPGGHVIYCQLHVSRCLLFHFTAVITGRMHGQAVLPKFPISAETRMCTDARYIQDVMKPSM